MARTKITARTPEQRRAIEERRLAELTPEQRKEREERAAAALVNGKRPTKRTLQIVKTTPLIRKSTMQSAGGIKKPHRFRAGTVAGREVTKLQKTTETLMPKASFLRVVRETTDGQRSTVYRISEDAKAALQQATEDYLIEIFRASDLVRAGSGPHPMDTLMVRHMQVANDVAAIYPGNCTVDKSIQRRKLLQEEYDRERAERRAKTELRKARASQKARKIIADSEKRRQEAVADDDDDETTDGNGNNDNDDKEEEDEEEEKEQQQAPVVQAPQRAFVIKGKKPRRNVDAVREGGKQAITAGGDAM